MQERVGKFPTMGPRGSIRMAAGLGLGPPDMDLRFLVGPSYKLSIPGSQYFVIFLLTSEHVQKSIDNDPTSAPWSSLPRPQSYSILYIKSHTPRLLRIHHRDEPLSRHTAWKS
jgi:hypothetical protein